MAAVDEHVDVDALVANEQAAYAGPLQAPYAAQPLSPPELPVRPPRSRPTNNQLL